METMFPGLRAALNVDLKLKKVVVTKEMGFSCDIYLAGERLGFFIDRSNGGQGDFEMPYAFQERLVKALRANNQPTLPPVPEDDPLYVARGPLSNYEFIESAIANLVFETHELKAMKRKCKTHVVIVMKDEAPGHYKAWKFPFTAETKKAAVEKFGDNISFFVNEDVESL